MLKLGYREQTVCQANTQSSTGRDESLFKGVFFQNSHIRNELYPQQATETHTAVLSSGKVVESTTEFRTLPSQCCMHNCLFNCHIHVQMTRYAHNSVDMHARWSGKVQSCSCRAPRSDYPPGSLTKPSWPLSSSTCEMALPPPLCSGNTRFSGTFSQCYLVGLSETNRDEVPVAISQ